MTRRIVLSLFVLASACGSVGSSDEADARPDPPRADAAPTPADAAPPGTPDAQVPPTTGVASVTVYNEGGFTDFGASVVFHHADGTVVQKLVTDSHGRASAVVSAGDQISVVRTTQQDMRQVTTFVGVRPGDQLHAGEPRPSGTGDQYGTLTVSGVSYAGASSYSVDAGCFDSGSVDEHGVSSFALYQGCHDAHGTLPLYLEARNQDNARLAYATRAIPGGGNGSVTLAPSDWRSDFASTGISIVHTPAAATLYPSVYVDNAPGQEVFEFYPTVAGNPQPGDDVNATVVLPRNLGTGYDLAVQEVVYHGSDQTLRMILGRKTGAPPSTVSVDAARLLPRLTSRVVIGTGDATRPSLSWSSESPLDGLDGAVVHTSWYDSATQATHEWIFVVPPGATSVQLPALPDSLADYRPSADAAPGEPAVYFVEASAMGGYDAFRARVGTYVYYLSGRTLIPLLPAGDGELRVTAIDIAGS